MRTNIKNEKNQNIWKLEVASELGFGVKLLFEE
jgi:hypothetical protein